jgi:threonine/homoserine/homoserine lactone efflux protein
VYQTNAGRRTLRRFLKWPGSGLRRRALRLRGRFRFDLRKRFLVDQQLLLRFVGGVFLLYLGFRIFRERPDERQAAISGTSSGGLAKAYSSTFLLTITNPLTILSFAAIFAGLGLVESEGYVLATVLVLGVFSGSALWWLLLSGGVSLFSSGLGLGTLRWVNRISGTIIFGFGVAALVNLLRGL